MTALENLKAARALIDTAGWCVFSVLDPNNRHCALGLIWQSYGGRRMLLHRPHVPALDILADTIPADRRYHLPDYDPLARLVTNIAGYNNKQTDVNVIKAWFDRAIAVAEAQQMWAELESAQPTAATAAEPEVKAEDVANLAASL